MKWRAVNENVIESDAGYTILRCTANGVPTGRYISFAGRYNPIGGENSREEAQKLCEVHYYQTQQALTA